MKVLFKLQLKHKKPRLTFGREYLVVGISRQSYRVMDDDEEPILYPKRYFTVSDSIIPDDWIRRDDDDFYYIDPPELSHKGFYDHYFDGDAESIKVFNKVLKRIISRCPSRKIDP